MVVKDMIENQKQFVNTLSIIEKFEKTLEQLKTYAPLEGEPEWVRQAQIEGVESLLETLRDEVSLYLDMRNENG